MRAKRPMPIPSAQYVAERLMPLDIDALAIMIDPPEQFPAFLVKRLCEIKQMHGFTGKGVPLPSYRPPLAEQHGQMYRLNALGKAVAALVLPPRT